jgi:hypothetical protein
VSVIAGELALSAGAEVWVVPEIEKSGWTKRVDWALGFQIAKAEPHNTVVLSEALKALMDEVEFDLRPVRVAKDAPMMFATEGRLPNRMTLRILVSDTDKEWVRQTKSVWEGLKRPSLRVFLPIGMSPAEFSKVWGDPQEVQLVADEEPHLNTWT